MKLPPPQSQLEATLLLHIRAAKLPTPVREHRFHPERKWRFDIAWPEQKLAVECEGGTRGREVRCHACGAKVLERAKSGRMVSVRAGTGHTAGKGYADDLEKCNAAQGMGWRVLRYTLPMIESGVALQEIRQALLTGGG